MCLFSGIITNNGKDYKAQLIFFLSENKHLFYTAVGPSRTKLSVRTTFHRSFNNLQGKINKSNLDINHLHV